MVGARLRGGELHVVQTGCGVAVRVGHQLHQQHAFKEVVGLGHAHTSVGQAVQRIHLGALPGGFLRLAAKLGALGHGARLAAVFDLAVLGVVHRLAKTAVGGFFVDLGATGVVPTAHYEHHGFLATHELAHHAVDQAFFNQCLQSLGGFHGAIFAGFGVGPTIGSLFKRPLGAALGGWVGATRGEAACLWLALAGFAVQLAVILASPVSQLQALPAASND